MRRTVLWLALGLAGCAGTPAGRLTGGGDSLSCVPYARARSGIVLRGDAWTWWDSAAGLYRRSGVPVEGAVLVINRTGRLRDGHVSVVTRVVGAREIRVDHANWDSGAGKGRVARDQPVIDVSPGNDWSVVRVWYPPVSGLGASAYPVRGFVLPQEA